MSLGNLEEGSTAPLSISIALLEDPPRSSFYRNSEVTALLELEPVLIRHW